MIVKEVIGSEGNTIFIKFSENREFTSFFRKLPFSYTFSIDTWRVTVSKENIDSLIPFLEVNDFQFNKPYILSLLEVKTNTDKIVITAKKREIVLNFKYDVDILRSVKAILNRRWDGKRWSIELCPQNLQQIKDFLEYYKDIVVIEENVLELIKQVEFESIQQSINLEKSSAVESDIEVSGLKMELRPFQKAGVEYIIRNKKVLLGDEMGLGKTAQAISSLYYLKAFPVLIVCPNSLKYNWAKEWDLWTEGVEKVILNSEDKFDICKNKQVIICNYNTIIKYKKEFETYKLKAIVSDESHYLKNRAAQRTKIFSKIGSNCEVKLLLTGTPITNKPSELISQLEILDKFSGFGGWFSFVRRYCGAVKGRFGWETDGATNLEELHSKLRASCYIRRNKKDVLTELPEKVRTIVKLDIDNIVEYRKAESDLILYFKEIGYGQGQIDAALSAENLVKINQLKQLSVQGKTKQIIDWIEDFLESGEKLVVFGEHTKIINTIAERFKCNKITGEVKIEDRQRYVEDFQNNKDTKLLVLNMMAGGVGLTLTESSNICFMELPWVPSDLLQAEDRCHRIGQRSSVNCYYFIGEKTIDEDIYELLMKKMQITSSVNAGVFDTKSFPLLSTLIKNIINERN